MRQWKASNLSFEALDSKSLRTHFATAFYKKKPLHNAWIRNFFPQGYSKTVRSTELVVLE